MVLEVMGKYNLVVLIVHLISISHQVVCVSQLQEGQVLHILVYHHQLHKRGRLMSAALMLQRQWLVGVGVVVICWVMGQQERVHL